MKSYMPACPSPDPVAEESEIAVDPGPVPRRGIDWELFESGRELELQRVDFPDERETAIFESDDEAAAFVVFHATSRGFREIEDEELDLYDKIRTECREALGELVRSWEGS